MPSQLTPATVRQAYIAARRAWEQRFTAKESSYLPGPMWDGGELHGRRYQPVWPKVVTYLMQRHFDGSIEEYMDVQFRQSGLTRPPAPNQVFNDGAWQSYLKRPIIPDLRRREFKTQGSKAAVEVAMLEDLDGYDKEQATLRVVLNADLQLSPLFRYCLASSVGTPAGDELAQKLFGQALKQFQSDVAGYQEHWASMLPARLKNMAARGGK